MWVKNIADFGAFVDLGGIDGLLHITDMSWERIGHPTEMVSIDQEIEVKVLQIDREKQKIALGLKQKQRNPWDNIEEKYPVGTVIKGEVVNVMSYGAFIKLEPGIEGLVQSAMSWTRRINHPNELVQIGDEIDVKILGVDPAGQQLSLGIKQTVANLGILSWTSIQRKRLSRARFATSPTMVRSSNWSKASMVCCTWRHVLDSQSQSSERSCGEGSRSSLSRVVGRPKPRARIALGLKQLDQDPWVSTIPEKYQPGQLVKGNVTKITNFGVFVGLEDGLEGLLHISELADHKIETQRRSCEGRRRDRSQGFAC